MSLLHPDARHRAEQYVGSADGVRRLLGAGRVGAVYETEQGSALKVFNSIHSYHSELAVYDRLTDQRVRRVRGFQVPLLLGSSDELRIIEMSVVRPPFVVDFAGATLDVGPDFDDDVVQAWEAEKQEQFGERWAEVLQVIAAFRNLLGIHLTDINHGNIRFSNDDD